MKKIPTLYVRDFENHNGRYVTDEVTPGCEWVIEGEGYPTFKWDGTSVKIEDGLMFKRRMVGAGRVPPPDFDQVDLDPVTGKAFGWVPCRRDEKADRWHYEAFDRQRPINMDMPAGTYELVGPKVQGNPHEFSEHTLIRHGLTIFPDVGSPKDLVRAWSKDPTYSGFEGVVFYHPDGRMAKLKMSDLKPEEAGQ